MKRKIGSDDSIDSLIGMMKESNLFDGEDEYNLLLEGYHCEWDDPDTLEILSKAVSRYNRYIRNINFGKYSYIEEMITKFLHKYEDNVKWTVKAMNEMVDIDGEILQIIQGEDKMEVYTTSEQKIKRLKQK